jgi:uncharacterized protein YndB with AHSA1/START domain
LFTYDFRASGRSGEPVSVRTTEQVHHTNASYSPIDPGETIETIENSDGMGRTVQNRVHAEDLDFRETGLTRSTVGHDIGSSVWVRLPSQTSLRRAMAAFKLCHFYTLYRTQLTSNGDPGWQVLGRGWQRLLEYEHALTLGMQVQAEM